MHPHWQTFSKSPFLQTRGIGWGMSVLFSVLLVLGLMYGLCTLGGEETVSALLGGGQRAVELCLQMGGGYLFWMGLLEVMEQSGAARGLSRLLSPLVRFCCPHSPRAWEPLALNLSANVLGLSGAATPFALEAMARMNEGNPTPGTATEDMCALVILNAGCLRLLPTGQMALRQAMGSAHPGAVLLPIMGGTLVSFLCALILVRGMRRS